jgi:hypothetical protein
VNFAKRPVLKRLNAMREIGPASNAEMVLSFLRAEIDSPRSGPHYIAVLNQMRADRYSLIDNGDLNDANPNRVRGRYAVHVAC